MARGKKKTGVVFVYPGVCYAGSLPKDRAWSLFHRNVGVGAVHDSDNEHCWCSPICIPTELIKEEGYTSEEYKTITHTSKH